MLIKIIFNFKKVINHFNFQINLNKKSNLFLLINEKVLIIFKPVQKLEMISTLRSVTNNLTRNKCHFKSVYQAVSYTTNAPVSAIIETNCPETFKTMENFMIVREGFLSEADEESLLSEVEPYMKKLRYEFDHWDNVTNKQKFHEQL